MAKKARKKSAAKAKKKFKKKSKAVTRKKKPAANKKAARKAKRKPQTIGDRVASAYHTVVDTVKDTDRLRNKIELPGTSETS